jgi:AcrR family transcriptional regulator
MSAAKTKAKKPARKSNARRSGDTRDRIIQRSMVLFNRKGLRNVSIERISADLKISPGNLTYHFPRKRDLLGATILLMKERLQTALQRPIGVRTPRDGAEYLLRLYRTLWDFRFCFNALTYILTDAHIKKEYFGLHRWALDTMEQVLDELCKIGHFLPPVAPNSFPLLAENMWNLWLSWLRMQQIENPLAATPDDAALYDCALHNWSLCQPCMRLDFARDLLTEFRNLLPNSAIHAASSTKVSKSRQ